MVNETLNTPQSHLIILVGWKQFPIHVAQFIIPNNQVVSLLIW